MSDELTFDKLLKAKKLLEPKVPRVHKLTVWEVVQLIWFEEVTVSRGAEILGISLDEMRRILKFYQDALE